MVRGRRKKGKQKSNTVHFLIHVFQTGHGCFLGACMECRFRVGDSTCWRLRQCLAKKKKSKKKTLQRFSLNNKAFSFIDESRQGESNAFCKICRCDFNILHGCRNSITAHAKTAKHSRNVSTEDCVLQTPKISSCFSGTSNFSTVKAEASTEC